MAFPVDRRTTSLVFLVLVAVSILPATFGRIHDLKIVGDDRTTFQIETFGFRANGIVQLEVKSFGISPLSTGAESTVKAGFILRKAESESEALATVEKALEEKSCLLDSKDNVLKDSKWLAPADRKKWSAGWKHEHVISENEAGLYQVIFSRCKPDGSKTVSFELVATFYNVDANGNKNYLSAGDSSLPTLYFCISMLFVFMLVAWVVYCRKNSEHVHHVHMMMATLLLLKALSSFFHSVSYHYIAKNGKPVGWNVVYYIFASLKGTMFFVVILLVGTGWSMVKPYLNEKEKKILLLVLPLQVFNYIAYVVIEEMSPGSQAWLSWRDLLNLFDIICCCMVLFPIVWQIRSLRIAAATDGKAERNMQKLMQYRNFYVAVVCYIYFTRIIVRLLGATVSYESSWMKTVAGEGATVAFFVMTGKAFRPMSNNPYLRVGIDSDDEGDDEFGLDDPIEIKPTAAGKKAAGTKLEGVEMTDTSNSIEV